MSDNHKKGMSALVAALESNTKESSPSKGGGDSNESRALSLDHELKILSPRMSAGSQKLEGLTSLLDIVKAQNESKKVDDDDNIMRNGRGIAEGDATKENDEHHPHTAMEYLRETMHHMTDVMKGAVNNEDLYPWEHVFIIAIVIGCIEYIPAAILGAVVPLRINWLYSTFEDQGIGFQILYSVTTSIALVTISVCTGIMMPSTNGSGIPPIIAYLSNGRLFDPEHFSVKTVLGKIVSVVAAISGGLVIGREGPAIHIGAALGDICHKYIDKLTEWWTGHEVPFDGALLSNVVMMGSAAGFASAFRAPIGGFMYIVEELAVQWNIQEHTTTGSQIFMAVASASFMTNLIVRLTSDSGTINFNSIIIYDDSNAANFSDIYKYADIPGFLVVALICGLFGGLYTHAAIYINRLRTTWTAYKEDYRIKILDGVLVATVTSLTLCLLPLIYSTCESNPDLTVTDDNVSISSRRLATGGGNRDYVQHLCEDENYSPMASLTLSGEEAVIRHLLSRDDENFGLPTLVIFLVFYAPLTLLVMGMPVACGTFVPNLLMGSLFGRIIGELVLVVTPESGQVSLPGVYALIGAGSLLGAWTRTMIAVVITIVEISGDVGIVIPLVFATLISRSVATRMVHHSYTHFLFYRLIDADPDDETAGFLHPNDWAPVVKTQDESQKGGVAYLRMQRKLTWNDNELTAQLAAYAKAREIERANSGDANSEEGSVINISRNDSKARSQALIFLPAGKMESSASLSGDLRRTRSFV